MCRRWPLFVFAVSTLILGCSKAPDPAANQSATSVAPPMDGHEMASASAPALSAEDQALADKQKVCPVGGEALGSMGTPVKVMIGDRAVFLCCSGCKETIEANPEKYLAKLDAAETAPAEPAAESPTEPAAPAAEAPATPAAETSTEPAEAAPAKPE